MPIIQQNPGWSSALGGLLGLAETYFGQQQAGKRQKAEIDRQKSQDQNTAAYRAATISQGQQRIDNEAKNTDLNRTKIQGDIDKQNQAAATAAALAKFRSGLSLDPNWQKMPAQQKVEFLQRRQQAAQVAGDKETFDETANWVKEIANPEEAAARRQQQMQELQMRLHDSDVRQNQRLQQSMVMAIQRLGQGHPLTQYESQELGLRKDEAKERKREFDATHPGGNKTTTQDARAKDYDAAIKAYNSKGADQDGIKRHFAAKWGVKGNELDGLFP